jgi:hypothetical protein
LNPLKAGNIRIHWLECVNNEPLRGAILIDSSTSGHSVAHRSE